MRVGKNTVWMWVVWAFAVCCPFIDLGILSSDWIQLCLYIYKKYIYKKGGGGVQLLKCLFYVFAECCFYAFARHCFVCLYVFSKRCFVCLYIYLFIFVKRCFVCLNMFLPSAVPINWWVTRLSFLFSLHLCWLFPSHLFPKECPWTLSPWQSRVRKCTLSRAWWFLWRVLHK